MKNTKRCFALLLNLALLLGACPFGVFAASDEPTDTGQEEVNAEVSTEPEETEEPEPTLGTVIDPETGTEYEILSSVEDIIPEELMDEPEETPAEEPITTEPPAIPAEEVAPAPEEPTATEGDEPEADNEIPPEYAEMDFSSRRILVSGADELPETASVLASYEDVALLQFESETDTMAAYAYYAETDAAVEVDAVVVMAEDVTSIEETNAPPVEMDEDINPLAALNEILEEVPPVSSDSLRLIAVIDTGASASGNVLERYSVLGGEPDDDNGHGAAMIDYITSINPDAAIISIKALDADGHGSMSSLYAAVKLAVELDADIINLSVYANKTDESSIVVGAIEDAVAAGITVVGAAGNSASDAAGYVPGCVAGAVIAGSMTFEHTLQPFSNYGATVDYYVQSTSTSQAAAIVTGYYSMANADFSNIDCETVFYVPDGVSDCAALDTDDFVIAWSGWPISVTEVNDTPVGIVSAGKIYFAVGGFNTHNFYAMYDGYVSDWTSAAAAPAYAYCVDATDTSASYNASHVYEIDITKYPILCAAVITAPTARTKNGANEIFGDMGISLSNLWAPLDDSCFDWLDDDANAHAFICYLFHGTWDFEPMNWPSAAITNQKTSFGKIEANLKNTFKSGSNAYKKLVSNFRVFVVSSASSSSSYQRFIFSIGVDDPGGSLKIVKNSDDGNVSGITFTVKNNDAGDTQTVKTGADGTFLMEGLVAGTYTVTETVPTEYVSSNSSQTVTVKDNETATVNFSNTLKKFRIQFTKVDKATGVPQGDATLAGAVYGLYQNGTEIARYTTDANGQFTTSYYTCGSGWTLKEITPPMGYTLDSTVHSVGASPGTFTASRNTIKAEVKETVITGYISVTKRATNDVAGTSQNENGATFEVYLKSAGSYASAAASERDILTTDESGRATSKKLPYGTYIVHQTSGWEGHILDDAEYELSITTNGQTVSVELENEIFKGTLQIVKRDKYTTDPLAGARFQIKNSDDFTVADMTTGDDGLVTVDDLVFGSYTYEELEAPEGYQRDETVYEFSITEDGQIVEHTRENLRIPGSISVYKTDANGQPLSGVIYLLEYSTDNGRKWSPVFSRTGDNVTSGGCTSGGLSDGKFITGGDGVAKFEGLRADGKILYRLTEVATQSGHTLLKDPIQIGTLPANGDGDPIYDISATIKEGAVFGLPMTGSGGFSAWPFVLAALLAAGGLFAIRAAVRRKRLYAVM